MKKKRERAEGNRSSRGNYEKKAIRVESGYNSSNEGGKQKS